MKKRLNVDLIQSELRGGSAFFPGYKGASPAPLPTPKPQAASDLTPEPTPAPPAPSPAGAKPRAATSTDAPRTDSAKGVPPGEPRTVTYAVPQGVPRTVPLIPKKPRRPIRQRQPFDIYEDQYQTLKKIATAEKGFENGRSMGQMVRSAIDLYLKNQHTS